MPAFLFTNFWMLAGMGALAIPVLIHLLLKRRKKRMRFSTIQFFQRQDEQSSRRRKLRNWLLLALRLLIVTLLVLAFARPYSRQNRAGGANSRKQQWVFVLDRSASMLATGSDGQRWTLAKDRIRKLLSSMGAEDSAALIGCADRADVVSALSDPAAVAKVLDGVQPSYGACSLREGLQQAVKLLTSADHEAHSMIYLVSDLQRTACQNLASCPVPEDVELKLLQVGDLHSPNLAISGLEVESRVNARPKVFLSNFSEEDVSDLALDLSVDDKVIFSRACALKSSCSTNIECDLPDLKPGWHDIKGAIRSKDTLELDNSRYAVLFVPEPVQVVIAQPKTTKRVFEEESFFLRLALNPADSSSNSVSCEFQVVQVSPEELPSKLSSAAGQVPVDVVILPGLKEVPSGLAHNLAAFVDGGGGLLVFLGEGVSANRYNNELRELLPGQLGELETAPDLDSGWRIGEYDTNTVPFAAFRLPNSGDLRIPQFTKRYAFMPIENASRLAFFEDGAPLLVSRASGRGRVALVNTTADTAWNDWPKHKTFVPWLHGLARYLAQKAGQQQFQQTNNFLAGADLELDKGPRVKGGQFKLRCPDGKELALTADQKGRLRDPGLSLPGFYKLRDSSGKEIRRLAVNLPSQESDLEALRPTDCEQQLVRSHQREKETLSASLFASRNQRKEFWSALLLAALFLLIVEPLIANRTTV